ncbi:hypothetical protein C0992_004059 [Termitomyces sp. T32_za158]|nr:hypothetical protein C0992_004059 [Termitomyces sp. T32_za158]
MQNTSFTVAGMSSSTSSHHSPNINSWGSTSTGPTQLGASFGESLSQSRSHYQPGYLLSSQNNASPQGNTRVDELPIVQTKAKMNHMLSRGPSDFGMSSMFENTRQRKNVADEDAPPINSVNDIPNEVSFTSSSPFHASSRVRLALIISSTINPPLSIRFPPYQDSADEVPLFARRTQRPTATPQQPTQTQQPIYIIVFGYPPEKYSTAVEFFQSLGATTDPDPHLEISNCFRIGFTDAGDALRAVRKNGEVLSGSWMVGVKWADQAQAEAVLSQLQSASTQVSESSNDNVMAVDEPSSVSPQKGHSTANLKGAGRKYNTPTRLAPATAAFRKHNPDAVVTPQPQRGWSSINPGWTAQQSQPQVQVNVPPGSSTPNKGMLGQVSDLIFGW